ncbi:hypothetical protein ECANGB1_1886 [Enterospora canceri]|uniref:Ricin B lectin domain-containing protein n=1 Tax=Enterospora canceri TaxID=1081671 RepID=A0A1Y1S8Y5_9MICR|nr:hypothetical protein ECANGB1_1886 [Enterospora canceri]
MVLLNLLSGLIHCEINAGDEFTLSVGDQYFYYDSNNDGVSGTKSNTPTWVAKNHSKGGLTFESTELKKALNYSPRYRGLVLYSRGVRKPNNNWTVIEQKSGKVQLKGNYGKCGLLTNGKFKAAKCNENNKNQLFTVHKKGEEVSSEDITTPLKDEQPKKQSGDNFIANNAAQSTKTPKKKPQVEKSNKMPLTKVETNQNKPPKKLKMNGNAEINDSMVKNGSVLD